MKDFWEMIIQEFTKELWIWILRVTRSTFDKLCDAFRPLVVPATSCSWEPLPTDTMWPVNLEKKSASTAILQKKKKNAFVESPKIPRDSGKLFLLLLEYMEKFFFFNLIDLFPLGVLSNHNFTLHIFKVNRNPPHDSS